MEPSDAQPELEAKSSYFDPDMPEQTEQQFSASLDAPIEKASFVLDPEQGESGAGAEHIEEASISAREDRRGRLSPRLEGAEPALEPDSVGGEQISDWRDQVSAKISSYKSRKPRQERFPSLQLQFDSTRYLQPTPKVDPEPSMREASAPEPSFVVEEPLRPRQPIILESTARILEFPRLAEAPVFRDELAEPMISQPRIVEAPEFPPPPPALGGILIEAPRQPEPERRPGFDMPLQSAPISRRTCAAGLDAIVVLAAFSVFVYFLLRFSGPVQQARTIAELIIVLIAILWPAYQYAFLVFSGTTPGLLITKLKVSGFDGSAPSRSLRRWRVLASLLSCISLGLGYAWCFLDEDQLSWHDRITRTHLAPED